jgi:hypothetical protein
MSDKTPARLPGLPPDFAPPLDGQVIYILSDAAPRQSKLFSIMQCPESPPLAGTYGSHWLVRATLPPEICFVNP